MKLIASLFSENIFRTLSKRGYRTNISAILSLIVTGLLASCSSLQTTSIDSGAEFLHLPSDVPSFAGERSAIIGADEIYRLSKEQQNAFLKYYRNSENQEVPGNERIVHYLSKKASTFVYNPATRTANEVFLFTGGNCLSLANATTALARLVNVRVTYQYMEDLPIFEKMDNIIFRGAHVRSVLSFPTSYLDQHTSKGTTILGANPSRVIVDYFANGKSRYVSNISEQEFTAMYYRNLAADAMAEENYSRTYWLIEESMIHAPDHPDALNMLAILYRRTGDENNAELVYRYGINRSNEKLSLLKNYRTLLKRQGRINEARGITQRIAKFEDADPFEWWSLAEGAYGEENYSDALMYYKKSVEIAPYLHEGYFGMAKTYYQLGRIDSAETAMASAVENASRKEFRNLYEVKLQVLSRYQ
jgi:Tfp pilus assembly protein PilF